MRDIPMFTTDYGVASLCLGNVAYTNTAYIHIQDTSEPAVFLKECSDFCRGVGAETVFATGHEYLENDIPAVSVLEMFADNLSETTTALLIPVQEETMEQWRTIYNQKMSRVPSAAHITFHAAKKYLKEGNCYFIYQNEVLIGIGVASGNRIDAVASLQKGAGKDIVLALKTALSSTEVTLCVAESNRKAIDLYQSLGFVITRTIEKWYKII